MKTCHKQAPGIFGDIATNIGETDISHKPGKMTSKFSLWAVRDAKNGGSMRHIIKLMLCIVYIGTDSPNLLSRKGGRMISEADQFIPTVIVKKPKMITIQVFRRRRIDITFENNSRILPTGEESPYVEWFVLYTL